LLSSNIQQYITSNIKPGPGDVKKNRRNDTPMGEDKHAGLQKKCDENIKHVRRTKI
jgi:hypothetical protein